MQINTSALVATFLQMRSILLNHPSQHLRKKAPIVLLNTINLSTKDFWFSFFENVVHGKTEYRNIHRRRVPLLSCQFQQSILHVLISSLSALAIFPQRSVHAAQRSSTQVDPARGLSGVPIRPVLVRHQKPKQVHSLRNPARHFQRLCSLQAAGIINSKHSGFYIVTWSNKPVYVKVPIPVSIKINRYRMYSNNTLRDVVFKYLYFISHLHKLVRKT